MDSTRLETDTTRISTATFEAVAVELGLMTPVQVDECRVIHHTLLDLGLTSSIADVCLKKGILTSVQVAAVDGALDLRGEVVFPGYEIIGKIAEGGMGVVYKARQVSMDRLVAVKLLLPKFANDQSGRERFIREARAVAKLSHPNVVAGIDAGETGGVFYFVMEYLDGEAMDQVLRRRGQLPWREAVAIVRQVALALDHADRHGLVHRDVKPGNIMLLKDGVVKLADLGLARATTSDDAALTQTGMIVGSPAYLSPEQARGEPSLDVRSDIFSLGLSLFEFVAGQRAYAGKNPMSVLTEVLTCDVAIEKLAALDVPAGMTAVLAKMTQRDRAQRYQTPLLLCEDLAAVLDGRPPRHAGTTDSARPGAAGSGNGPIRKRLASVRSSPVLKPRLARLGLAAGFALLVLGAALWSAGKRESTGLQSGPASAPAPRLEANVNIADAVKRAQPLVPGGVVYHVEQELDRYSIDFAVADRTVNVVIGVMDGRVVETLEEDGDHSMDVRMSDVPLMTAVHAAQRAVAGRAVEAEILLLSGRTVIEVKLARDGKVVWVDVDGVTGKVSDERFRPLLPN